MGIDSGSTNRWKNARERNRLKARFDIQSNVAKLVQMEQSISSERNNRAPSLDEMNIILKYLQAIIKNDVSTFSVTSLASHHQDDIGQYQLVNGPLPHYATTEINDTNSTFFDLSGGVPKNGAASVEQAKHALNMMISTNIPWIGNMDSRARQSQPATLATSKYGRNYVTERLVPYMNYLQSHGDNLTLMEYASLVGRHQIVGLLLLGGFDPSMMRMAATKDDDDRCDGKSKEEEEITTCYKRAREITSRKVLSFFHYLHTNGDQTHHDQSDEKIELDSGSSVIIPMSIWQYIIRAVVEMRINGALANIRESGQQSTEEKCCSLCNIQHQSCHQHYHPLLLNFGPPCNHSFCEPCLWEHLLQHVPRTTDLKSRLVTCPVCSEEIEELQFCENGDLNHNRQKERETSTSSNNDGNGNNDIVEEKKDDIIHGSIETSASIQRRERRLQSYTKFMALPATSTELKLQSRTKDNTKHHSNQQKFNSKRRKAKDPIHPTWEEALQPLVEAQLSRDVRSDRFFRAVVSSSVQLVITYLNAGIDVNMQNEYGQTPLYIACWKGSIDVCRWLLNFGAEINIYANGGSSCYSVARGLGRIDVMELLLEYHDQPIQIDDESPAPHRNKDDFIVTTLIDENSDHPGAGACIVDNALSDEQLCFLDSLQQSLPVIEACDEDAGGQSELESRSKSDKSSYRPSRSYYCDVFGCVQKMLQGCIIAARQSLTREHQENVSSSINDTLPPKSVFQHIRFLKYERRGGVLPPHVDLCRVDEKSGQRSTHTFILYLTDCEHGGGTALLDELSSPTVLAVAQPRRGRALIFPHNTAHSGLEVDCVPKVLLRGEVIL